jgi:hypothetical protein
MATGAVGFFSAFMVFVDPYLTCIVALQTHIAAGTRKQLFGFRTVRQMACGTYPCRNGTMYYCVFFSKVFVTLITGANLHQRMIVAAMRIMTTYATGFSRKVMERACGQQRSIVALQAKLVARANEQLFFFCLVRIVALGTVSPSRRAVLKYILFGKAGMALVTKLRHELFGAAHAATVVAFGALFFEVKEVVIAACAKTEEVSVAAAFSESASAV